MKKTIIAMSVAALMTLGSFGLAGATLIDLENGVIQNDDQFWIKDLSLFSNQTYSEVLSTIDTLNQDNNYVSSRWGQWHLATLTDVEALFAVGMQEVTDNFTSSYSKNSLRCGTFTAWLGRYDNPIDLTQTNGNSAHYVAGRYIYAGPNGSGEDNVSLPGYTGLWDQDAGLAIGAWVVADAANLASPVPEPGTLLLLGTGLVGLARFSRGQFRKKSQK